LWLVLRLSFPPPFPGGASQDQPCSEHRCRSSSCWGPTIHGRSFLITPLRPRFLAHRELEHFGQVERSTIGRLRDLFTATEPVGDDQGVAACFPHRRQQDPFAARHGDLVVVSLEPKGAGHAAAAGVRHREVDSIFFSTASSSSIFMMAL
jgi:hypothetical protein